MRVKIVKDGDTVVLHSEKNKKIMIKIEDKTHKIKGIGVYNTANLIGKCYGSMVNINRRNWFIFQPSVCDKIEGMIRKSQIVLPKDASSILFYCDIKNGDTVVECGFGSGALTMALANAVMPDGKVITYEKRYDFAEFAMKNIRLAGYEQYVTVKHADVLQGIDERDVDAVVMDIPNPWDCVENVYDALRICGHFCSFLPTTNQVEKTVTMLRKKSFANIRVIENIQRQIVVGKGGVRPDFHMLGHTGYLIFARKIIESD